MMACNFRDESEEDSSLQPAAEEVIQLPPLGSNLPALSETGPRSHSLHSIVSSRAAMGSLEKLISYSSPYVIHSYIPFFYPSTPFPYFHISIFPYFRSRFHSQTLFIHTPSQQSVATSSLTSNRTVLEFLSSQKGNRSEEWEKSEQKKEGPLGVEPGTTSCRDYGSNAISSSQESAPCEF
ncbi:hypothetical protein WR25_11460 [Diploscapter pachys]|uniref:Uncharacterized protein n=1 Tax=Diploscapter pachys TaxID=2018661 RepID=A0A2A2J6J7_9BILA|nr:hypothetical protein WR25_11460 [Diploscapter pachys]